MNKDQELTQAVFKIITECDQTGDADDTCYFGAEEIIALVRESDKKKDNEIAEFVNDLTYNAKRYAKTGQLREQMRRIVLHFLAPPTTKEKADEQ